MKGLICVERKVGKEGRLCWLPLEVQWTYKEWVGCFSLLGEIPVEKRANQ